MRNGSLWSNVVYKKEVIFHEFDFKTSELDFEVSKFQDLRITFWGLKIKHLNAHILSVTQGVFSFIIFSQFRQPIELKFSQVCLFVHMLTYTKCGPLDNTVYRNGFKHSVFSCEVCGATFFKYVLNYETYSFLQGAVA